MNILFVCELVTYIEFIL